MSGDNTFEVTDDFVEDTFDKLLKLIWENDLELSKEKPKTVMGHQLYVSQGKKETSFLNFVDVCKKMHRQPDHVMAFLLAELGASGSLHKQRRLYVDGSFPAEDFEEILRRYAIEYVFCVGCKSPDTTLSEDNCLFFLRCEKCGVVQSVAPAQDKVAADISPFDPTEKKKKKKRKKKQKQVRVGEDEEGITWPVSMQGDALQMFHSG
ncbi:unnamed protein product [Prunus armeniaca]|uniref:Eukaryotic translation initiation factor 2 subunit beta n=1 Tax=Prunus armeniaca TaxID=36596 RepID=A0A6J5URJ4_PRUAR|nr:unnamed protein product [Prunus armeniaca]